MRRGNSNENSKNGGRNLSGENNLSKDTLGNSSQNRTTRPESFQQGTPQLRGVQQVKARQAYVPQNDVQQKAYVDSKEKLESTVVNFDSVKSETTGNVKELTLTQTNTITVTTHSGKKDEIKMMSNDKEDNNYSVTDMKAVKRSGLSKGEELEEGELEEEEKSTTVRTSSMIESDNWKRCVPCDVNFSTKEEYLEHEKWSVAHKLKTKNAKDDNTCNYTKRENTIKKSKECLEATSTSELISCEKLTTSDKKVSEPSSTSDSEPTSTNDELPLVGETEKQSTSTKQTLQKSSADGQGGLVKPTQKKLQSSKIAAEADLTNDNDSILCATCQLRFRKPEHYAVHIRGMVHLQKSLAAEGKNDSNSASLAAVSSSVDKKDNTESSALPQNLPPSLSTDISSSNLLTSNVSKQPIETDDWHRCIDCNISFNSPAEFRTHVSSDVHAAIVSLNIAKKLQNVGKSAQGSITTDSGSSLRMPSGQVIRPMNDITQWQRPRVALKPLAPLVPRATQQQAEPRQFGAVIAETKNQKSNFGIEVRGPVPSQINPIGGDLRGPISSHINPLGAQLRGPVQKSDAPQNATFHAELQGVGLTRPIGPRPSVVRPVGPSEVRPTLKPSGNIGPGSANAVVTDATVRPTAVRPGMAATRPGLPSVRPYAPAMRPTMITGQQNNADADKAKMMGPTVRQSGPKPKKSKLLAQIQSELDQCDRPLIGLEHIIEYVDKDTGKRLSNELSCELCNCFLTSSSLVISHVTGQKHRFNCFQEHYPNEFDQLVMDSNNPIGAPLNELYEKFAREVERREGRHTVSVQELEVPLREEESRKETKVQTTSHLTSQTPVQPLHSPYWQTQSSSQFPLQTPSHPQVQPPLHSQMPPPMHSQMPPPMHPQMPPPMPPQMHSQLQPALQLQQQPQVQSQLHSQMPPPVQPSSQHLKPPPAQPNLQHQTQNQVAPQTHQMPPQTQSHLQSAAHASMQPALYNSAAENQPLQSHSQLQQYNRVDYPSAVNVTTAGETNQTLPTSLNMNSQTMQAAATRAIELLQKLSTEGVDNDEEAEVAYKLSTALSQALIEYRSRKEAKDTNAQAQIGQAQSLNTYTYPSQIQPPQWNQSTSSSQGPSQSQPAPQWNQPTPSPQGPSQSQPPPQWNQPTPSPQGPSQSQPPPQWNQSTSSSQGPSQSQPPPQWNQLTPSSQGPSLSQPPPQWNQPTPPSQGPSSSHLPPQWNQPLPLPQGPSPSQVPTQWNQPTPSPQGPSSSQMPPQWNQPTSSPQATSQPQPSSQWNQSSPSTQPSMYPSSYPPYQYPYMPGQQAVYPPQPVAQGTAWPQPSSEGYQQAQLQYGTATSWPQTADSGASNTSASTLTTESSQWTAQATPAAQWNIPFGAPYAMPIPGSTSSSTSYPYAVPMVPPIGPAAEASASVSFSNASYYTSPALPVPNYMASMTNQQSQPPLPPDDTTCEKPPLPPPSPPTKKK